MERKIYERENKIRNHFQSIDEETLAESSKYIRKNRKKKNLEEYNFGIESSEKKRVKKQLVTSAT